MTTDQSAFEGEDPTEWGFTGYDPSTAVGVGDPDRYKHSYVPAPGAVVPKDVQFHMDVEKEITRRIRLKDRDKNPSPTVSSSRYTPTPPTPKFTYPELETGGARWPRPVVTKPTVTKPTVTKPTVPTVPTVPNLPEEGTSVPTGFPDDVDEVENDGNTGVSGAGDPSAYSAFITSVTGAFGEQLGNLGDMFSMAVDGIVSGSILSGGYSQPGGGVTQTGEGVTGTDRDAARWQFFLMLIMEYFGIDMRGTQYA